MGDESELSVRQLLEMERRQDTDEHQWAAINAVAQVCHSTSESLASSLPTSNIRECHLPEHPQIIVALLSAL